MKPKLPLEITPFSTHDPIYTKSLELRERCLRIPLGLSLADEDLSDEVNQLHFGLFDGEQLIASLILKPLGSDLAKLRQMVVDDSARGRGHGAKLVKAVEAWAWDNGYRHIELAARYYAKGFYEKLGYVAYGELFKEVTLDHIKMSKHLGV